MCVCVWNGEDTSANMLKFYLLCNRSYLCHQNIFGGSAENVEW